MGTGREDTRLETITSEFVRVAAADAALECRCHHSAGAHRHSSGACAFCPCDGFHLPGDEPQRAEEKHLSSEVAAALRILRDHPAFRAVPLEPLKALGHAGRRRFVSSGTILLDEGDLSDQVYLV